MQDKTLFCAFLYAYSIVVAMLRDSLLLQLRNILEKEGESWLGKWAQDHDWKRGERRRKKYEITHETHNSAQTFLKSFFRLFFKEIKFYF